MTESAETSKTPAMRPRLAIKKMVLENFKSYAGAQHVGPFHKVRGEDKMKSATRERETRD